LDDHSRSTKSAKGAPGTRVRSALGTIGALLLLLFQFDKRAVTLWALLASVTFALAGLIVALWRLLIEGDVSGALWALGLGAAAAAFVTPKGF